MNSRLSSFSEIIGVSFEEFLCVLSYSNVFWTPLMSCAECFTEYKCNPNLEFAGLQWHISGGEWFAVFCNPYMWSTPRALWSRGHWETGCPRQAVQVGLGTSRACAVQGYSCFLCSINLQRAVSDKRLRWAFQELKSRKEAAGWQGTFACS